MTRLTLAIASSDGRTVCDHLARATSFYVFTGEHGAIAGDPEIRLRGAGECGSHRTFVELLDGCDAVICGGIGEGAARSLRVHRVRSVIAVERLGIEEALAQHLAGTLKTTSEMTCLCGPK